MILGIIPARYASTRFPGKLLADLNGKPVLQWTWERASGAKSLDRLLIAAADEKISQAARTFGAEVIDIFKNYSSGSDRIAEAVRQLEGNGESIDIVVNIQGDEPLLDPSSLDATINRLHEDLEASVATPVTPLRSIDEYTDPSVVKVVVDACGYALYFSRAPIPHGWNDSDPIAFRHIGLYAYRKDALLKFTAMPPSRLEITEKLEQLRLLEHGFKIATVVVEQVGRGVDKEEDLEKIRRITV